MSTTQNPIGERLVDNQAAAARNAGFFSPAVVWSLCLAALIVVGVLRIVSTYRVFNHTIDEPSHLACGLEWWEKGTYTIETKHTPLVRISVAALPYIAGLRSPAVFKDWRDTYPILSADGHYWRNLTLARMGVLPYFAICAVVVFFWTKRLYGVPAGLLAAAVFTLLPTILAHSALATTDIGFTAMFCWALYTFTLWLARPSVAKAAHFGVATGLAICAKLSAVALLPPCGIAILALYGLSGRADWRGLLRTVVVAALCGILVTWAVYRFSHVPIRQVTTVPDRAAAKTFGEGAGLTRLVRVITSHLQVPAPEFLDGVRMMRQQRNDGTIAYLFGHVRKQGGWWYFFIVALALKTPLAVLVLAGIGTYAAAVRYVQNRIDWELVTPIASAVMILIVTAPSGLNSGVRYVMPMFALFSILAGIGLLTLWTAQSHARIYQALSILLLAWLVFSSVRAHPDYLSYFNEFGGSDPSRLLVISDYDWGQDLTRLSAYLRKHNINHVSIAYDGFYEPSSLGLPETEKLPWCDTHPSGWVAIETRRWRLHPECFTWLPQQPRLAVVGKTEWIYYIPERPPSATPTAPAN